MLWRCLPCSEHEGTLQKTTARLQGPEEGCDLLILHGAPAEIVLALPGGGHGGVLALRQGRLARSQVGRQPRARLLQRPHLLRHPLCLLLHRSAILERP